MAPDDENSAAGIPQISAITPAANAPAAPKLLVPNDWTEMAFIRACRGTISVIRP